MYYQCVELFFLHCIGRTNLESFYLTMHGIIMLYVLCNWCLYVLQVVMAVFIIGWILLSGTWTET